MWKRVLLAAAVAAVAAAYLTWPRINDVETGRTPEYPDLQPRTYGAGEEAVVRAVKGVFARLPRWRLVGEARGPAGIAIQAEHRTRVFRFTDDVTVRIRREGGRTVVSVRSRSRIGRVDFGQNARNIRELLAALDAELR
jgi:uncharacterized protein (DUF1499 family)